MKKTNVNLLCCLALLIAMDVLLSLTVAIRTPYFKFSFGSLPVVLAAMLFGPLAGAVVAVFGEFLIQLLTYGLMPTTLIWIFPPAARALVVGFAAMYLRRTGVPLERRPHICYAVCVLGAIATTTCNTFGMWLDSLFYRTSFAPALFITPGRYVTGVLTAIIIATVCIPLVHLLRRSGVLRLFDRTSDKKTMVQ